MTLEEALEKDPELRELQEILYELADNYATEYDHYDDVKARRDEIVDELIFEILDEYLAGNHLNDDDDDDICTNLETKQIQFICRL